MTYDPDAVLANPDAHPVHKRYAAINVGVRDRGEVKLRVGGDCPTVLEKVAVRVHKDFRLEVHIDTDEGNACNLRPDTPVELFR